MKLRRPDPGTIAVAYLVWGPAWMIGAILIGGHTAATIGVGMAVAPLLVMLLCLWAALVAAIRTIENAAIAITLGVPLLLFLFGPRTGAAAIGVSLLWWLGSRALFKWLDARDRVRITPPSGGASYIGGLLLEPRSQRQDRQAHP